MNNKLCYLLNCTKKNKCCNSIHWHINNLYGGGNNQWTTLEHNGPLFPPEYKPHNIPIIIKNKEIKLSPLTEEYATMYSKYIDTPYITSSIFKKNFWKEFKPELMKDINDKELKLENIDFSLIHKYLLEEKEKKNLISKEEKEIIKASKEELEKIYKYCIIDGVQQTVGNFRIEPPGIFIGRGTHPKLGMIKKRVYPEDVIINISEEVKIPEPSLKGHKWKEIIHDKSVVWLASWKEPITNKNKYIFTSFDSFFKAKSDENKFNLAKQLKKKVLQIRNKYIEDLDCDEIKTRQLASALYFIDNLALRAGGNKNVKEEADTVGVTSLRVEHIQLLDDFNIKLDFLGKDSVRYCKKIKVIESIYNNIKDFSQNKNKKDELFDKINNQMLNLYLDSFMSGLTSKVWRTYNASINFQNNLDKINTEKLDKMDINEKLNYLIAIFNQANTAVAILCNHQKSKTTSNTQIDKFSEQIKNLVLKKKKYMESQNMSKVKIIVQKIKLLKLKKKVKSEMKNVSLGTSKNNYIDPRIIFSFIKKFNIPAEKLFTKTLLKRFEWASQVDANYRF